MDDDGDLRVAIGILDVLDVAQDNGAHREGNPDLAMGVGDMCQEERLDCQVVDRHDWNILGTSCWGNTNLALDARHWDSTCLSGVASSLPTSTQARCSDCIRLCIY
jgi:hypothetical protein